MKKLKFHRAIVAIAMTLIGWLPTLAYSFEVDGIHYNRTEGREVEVISKGHFENGYVGSIIIPSSVNYKGRTYDVTSIGTAFNDCTSLTSIEIPNSVTSIESCAFLYCTSLTSIEIPNSVTWIGDCAFEHCTSLTSIEIPNSVTWIGDAVFMGCTSLTSIVVDSGNTKYDSRNDCNAIIETASNTLIAGCQNTIIPNSVTSIGDEAFYVCTNLTSIQIPHSVTSIGDRAFYRCTNLTSIEIPNSVTSIGNSVFEDCSSLTSIVVQSYNSKYDSRNGCNAIIETASNTLIAGCQNTIIPNSVIRIGDSAFSWCTSLTSIRIPNSVTSIGDEAFYVCTSLTSIQIPNSVTSIGDEAFCSCQNLTSIEIGNSVTSIGSRAFSWCESLTEITCWATTPPRIESDTFSNYSAELYVPTGSKETYEAADYWRYFNIFEGTLDNPITLNDNDAIVATIGDSIVVKNATVGSVVRVYTADGAMIASEVATEGDVIIEAPVKGIYVVKVGKQTEKVII